VTSDIDFATLDLLPYGVIVLDGEGTVLYYNEREEQIASRSRTDVVGRNFFKDIAPCTEVREFREPYERALRLEGSLPAFHFRFPFPGNPREVDITLTGFRYRDQALCLVAVADVTEQQAIRDRILQSERLRQIGEVAAGVAHNFNNLIQVMSGNAELALLKMAPDHPARSRVEAILHAAQDAGRVVHRLRATAQQTPRPSRKDVQVNDVAREALEWARPYAADKGGGAELRSELDATLPAVRGDAAELREVALNLVRNAIDALDGRGQVTVMTGCDADGVWLEVADTGRGMDDTVRSRLFQPLFTTKGEHGTGMGLATCWAIVRRHAGRIDVESEAGRGSRFKVHLPLAR
jgi:photoactive yellow protein